MLQLTEVKRQRGRRQIQLFGNLPRRQPLRSGLNQKPEHIQPGFLGERIQGRNSVNLLQISIMMEI